MGLAVVSEDQFFMEAKWTKTLREIVKNRLRGISVIMPKSASLVDFLVFTF